MYAINEYIFYWSNVIVYTSLGESAWFALVVVIDGVGLVLDPCSYSSPVVVVVGVPALELCND